MSQTWIVHWKDGSTTQYVGDIGWTTPPGNFFVVNSPLKGGGVLAFLPFTNLARIERQQATEPAPIVTTGNGEG